MSQFTEIMDKLDEIEATVVAIHSLLARPSVDLGSFKQGLESEDLELEDDSDGERVVPIEDTGVPRRQVPYKTINGEDRQMDANKLEKKVQQVMAIAQRRGDPWQLYESPSGSIMIMVSAETVAEWNAQYPGQSG